MRGEGSFLAAGGEKCSCPCAAAGGATSGAARGGAGLRAERGPGCGAPRPSLMPDLFLEEREALNAVQKQRSCRGWARRLKIGEIPAGLPRTSRSDSGLVGQEDTDEEPRSPEQSGVRGVLPLPARERHREGAPRRGWSGEARDPGWGTEEQSCPERVPHVDARLGVEQLSCGLGAAPWELGFWKGNER